MIYIENKKKSVRKLEEKYPNAHIVDVTSKATDGLVKLSPFFPHGGIPIPFSDGYTSMSVEGIWQGLKVFEKENINMNSFRNEKMKNIKRTVRKYGVPLGHRKGVNGLELLDYIEARIKIYLPAYLWVLEKKVQYIINKMRQVNDEKDIVLLDYTTNCDVLDARKPLSHAYLVKAYLEGNYPTSESLKKAKEDKHKLVEHYKKFQEIWNLHSSKELSKVSGIGLKYVQKIKESIAINDYKNLNELIKIKGIGKATIKKLLKFMTEYQKTNSQPTLFK